MMHDDYLVRYVVAFSLTLRKVCFLGHHPRAFLLVLKPSLNMPVIQARKPVIGIILVLLTSECMIWRLVMFQRQLPIMPAF